MTTSTHPPPSHPRTLAPSRSPLGQIVEGNWVVKRAAGTTPAILGMKLKQHHFRGDNYLETDLEIGACSRLDAPFSEKGFQKCTRLHLCF